MQDNRIDALLQMLAGKSQANEQGVKDRMVNSLSAEQKALFTKALSDRDTAQQLLQTPQAMEILKKLQGNGGKNGSE
ncbi:MAG: hypothetical protein IKJ63_05605 [Clostridia bacterium]|nr:hypothetical protein [Clostridia bacterium]MBR2413116.1 hypothetical protein [Clostridia bacterium]MBR3954927.1 hypothetical protein [Clostridia bacterium]